MTGRDASESDARAEARLQEATERFRLAFEGAPIGIALVGLDGRWLQVNAALCEIVGYGADELSTKTFQDITHPDDLEADLTLLHQVLAGEISSYAMEKRYFHADGHVVWINLSVGLVRDLNGIALYFVSQIEDITERRRVSAELASAEERFRVLLEFAPDAIVIIDHAGMITLVNRQTEELFGYPREELIGGSVEVLLPEQLRDAHICHRADYLADPGVRPMGAGLELRGRRRDGTEFPVEVSLSPLETDAGSMVSAAVRDITERKRAAATVSLLERVAVAANEASDVDTAYETTLREVCAYTGWSVGHVYVAGGDGTVGLVSSGIWHLNEGPRFERFRLATDSTPRAPSEGLAGRVLETGRAGWADDTVSSSRGLLGRALGLRVGAAFPVLVGQEVVAVCEFFGETATELDAELLEIMTHVGTQLGRVVERARLQDQQQELDAARARFVANAAHELRTPLATLRTVAALLGTRRDEMTADEVAECFAMLERQGESLEALVKDLLDLSQLEHGDSNLPYEVLPVAGWIAAALEIAPPPHHVTIKTQTHPGLAVVANTDRLNRVLVNLLTNAYRYGGPLVMVTATRDGPHAVITVEDNGDGVPERLLGQLFEPFTRAGNRDTNSSGLGLAISRRIVESFGGNLTYETADAGGAQLIVRLPAS